MFLVLILLSLAAAYCSAASDQFRPNIFVLTDIENEPDDAQSLIRLLLYSNEIEILGITAVTSVWLNDTIRPDQVQNIVEAYGGVVDNLRIHDERYPSVDHLLQLLSSGKPVYGMDAVNFKNPSQVSDGANALIKAVDGLKNVSGNRDDDDLSGFLWVTCWGGANVLAEALNKVRHERTEDELNQFISKIKVYAISDQDDAGPWIRINFPQLDYVASVHTWNEYGLAEWVGLSGEKFYNFDEGGPDTSLVSHEWLKSNIQIGPLGAFYPDFAFIMEGDTPTFLGLIPNGLNHPARIDYGGWGGRYKPVDQSLKHTHHYADAADAVVGLDGRTYRSNQACIWRWRHAYQSDFAARMQWTLKDSYQDANHAPVVDLNGTTSARPYQVTVPLEKAGNTSVILDVSQSYDPDKDDRIEQIDLFQYKEVSSWQWATHFVVPELSIEPICDTNQQTPCGQFKVLIPPRGDPRLFPSTYHLIVQIKDSGVPQMYSYRRVIVNTSSATERATDKDEL